MRHYQTIDELAAAGSEELTAIPDIGETTAACISDFFSHPANQALIEALKAQGVNMTMPEQTAEEATLAGLTIVVTGTLPSLGRKEAEELITSKGGKCTGSVSKKTSYLLAGEAAGSKLQKAHELGIPVITEEQFLRLAKKGSLE